MVKLKSVALALGVTSALTAGVALQSAPVFAQDDTNSSDAYGAGMAHGHTLDDPGECEGSGSYREGCASGAEESHFDDDADQAEQARSARMNDAKPSENWPPLSPPHDQFHDAYNTPSERAPLLSPPSGLFQDPYSEPGDSGPPNH